MSAPDSDITPLDPRFPIALTAAIPIFGALLRDWEDQETVIDQARRAAEQAMRQEERYVTTAAPGPEPLPRREPCVVPEALHHGDMLPGGAYYHLNAAGDMFVRDETSTRIEAIWDEWTEPRSLAREIRAAERRPLRRARRAIGRLLAAGKGER